MARLKGTPAEIKESLQLLEDSIQRIQKFIEKVDPEKLRVPIKPDERSPVEILAHLRGCADVWTYSVYAMLAQDGVVLPAIHPNKWAKVTNYAELDFVASFQTFRLVRAELLFVLNKIPIAMWERTCIVDGRTYTIYSQIHRMGLHEAEHCGELESLLPL